MGRWPDGEVSEETEEGADELEGEWELDPNDPTHPDFDLSEAAGYADWEPTPKPLLVRRGVILLLTMLVLLGLVVIPICARLT
jgi:hypothetical protein